MGSIEKYLPLLTPRSRDIPPRTFPDKIASLCSALPEMPRKTLTLEALVAEHRFDPSNFRHRRALDESGPLDDPELEEARRHVLDLRGPRGARVRGAEALQEFARLVAGRPG